jgi:hypothetical protein
LKPTIEAILKSPCGARNQHLVPDTGKTIKKVVKARNDCKEVQWIHWQLKYWCEKIGFIVIPELKFDKKRKYRFDFVVMKGVTEKQAREFEYTNENIVAAIEYQGGIFMKTKSGHSSAAGATRDSDKSNLAQSLGWPLLTFTALNYQNVIRNLENLIKND